MTEKQKAIPKTRVIVISGSVGSGKSTVAPQRNCPGRINSRYALYARANRTSTLMILVAIVYLGLASSKAF